MGKAGRYGQRNMAIWQVQRHMDERAQSTWQKPGISKSDQNYQYEYVVSDQVTQYMYPTQYSVVFKLFGDIKEPESREVQKFIDYISNPQVSEINILINSFGGDWNTQIMLYNVLEAQKQHQVVRTYGFSQVFSAASTIFMQGDIRILSKYTDFMVHSPLLQYDSYISVPQLMRTVHNHYHTSRDAIRKIYKGYLSDKELDQILENGEELYLHAEEQLEKGIATHVGYISLQDLTVVEYIDDDVKEEEIEELTNVLKSGMRHYYKDGEDLK